MANYRPQVSHFLFLGIDHYFFRLKYEEHFTFHQIYSTNILVRLLTINMKNGLTPKNSILCDPIPVTLLKMRPHYSHSSHQNATPPSGTSPLATYKEVTPRIISNPWQNYILDSMLWILDSRNWISDSWSMDLGFRFSIVFYSRFWKLKIPKPWFPHSGFYWQEKITWILKGGAVSKKIFCVLLDLSLA